MKQEWSEIYSNWQSKPDQKNPHHYRCNSHQNFYRNEIKLVWILQKQKINITKKKIKTKRWQTTRQIMSKPILFEAITLTADMNHGDRQQSKKSEKTWYHEGSKTVLQLLLLLLLKMMMTISGWCIYYCNNFTNCKILSHSWLFLLLWAVFLQGIGDMTLQNFLFFYSS